VAELIDLLHLDRPWVIGSYLLVGPEPAIVDCGPTTCVETLEAGLAAHGLSLRDLRHLILTHIHLDHAGAAGTLVRRHPGLRVHVSAVGAPHLVDPERLERSARRLYGDEFDLLWGELAPTPEENIDVIGERVLDLEAWPTPGHASHHVSFLAPDGSCYSGDATGVRIQPATFIAPVAPPPDIDVEAWERTIASIEERRPERLCLPHFGVVEEPATHLLRLRARLEAWAERVRDGATEEEFVAAAEEELAVAADVGVADAYRQAAPFWQSHAGLKRYWEKRRQAAGATL
jgi:glyoxylase-like metal-dependent hydrolase (beta-lactamase superfamily II)